MSRSRWLPAAPTQRSWLSLATRLSGTVSWVRRVLAAGPSEATNTGWNARQGTYTASSAAGNSKSFGLSAGVANDKPCTDRGFRGEEVGEAPACSYLRLCPSQRLAAGSCPRLSAFRVRRCGEDCHERTLHVRMCLRCERTSLRSFSRAWPGPHESFLPSTLLAYVPSCAQAREPLASPTAAARSPSPGVLAASSNQKADL